MSEPIRPSVQLSLAAAFAAFAGTFGLVRLIQPGMWAAECLLLATAVAGTGYVLRLGLRGRGGALRLVVVAGQIVVGGLIYLALFAHSTAKLGFIPWPGTARSLNVVLSSGIHEIQTSVPPAAAGPGIGSILCLICLSLALLIDALAATFHRAVLTGLPLLAVFLVPATRLPGGLSWLDFAAVSSGYLILVGVEGQGRLLRWGHPTPGPGRANTSGRPDRAAKAGTHQPLAARITITSVVMALILPVFIPTFPNVLKMLGSGSGGNGPSSAAYSLSTDVDLRSSLNSTTPVPLFQYTSTATDVSDEYLGTSVLDEFDGDTWKASNQATDVVNAGTPGLIPGLTTSRLSQTPVTTKITITGNYAFGPVPTPYATESISGLTTQLTEPATLGFTTSGPSAPRLGVQYTSSSIDIVPTIPQLQSTPAADRTEYAHFLQLPASLPADVAATARSVTAGDNTPYSKALALQTYFLKNFTYSLQVPYGESNQAIDAFLTQKIGFCQQFAATMAVMARTLGIPAVVAVGYTPGTKGPDGDYQVNSHDAHSWPLLYFSGVGWVRFEPTPDSSTAEGSQPAWAPASGATSSPTTTPTAGAGATPTVKPSSSACPDAPNARIKSLCGNPGENAATQSAFAAWGPFGAIPRGFERIFLSGGYPLITLKLLLLAFVLSSGFPAYARITRRRKRRVLVRKLNRMLARAADESKAAWAQTGPGEAEQLSARSADRADGRRSRSLFAQAAQAAWAELRENADDLGYSWDESDTPRQATARLSRLADLDESASAAAARITMLAERAGYAPACAQPTGTGAAGDDGAAEPDQIRQLSRDLDLVRSGLAANSPRSARLRAALLPASSLNRMRHRRERLSSSAYDLLHPRKPPESPAKPDGKPGSAAAGAPKER
jgi:transglutaminase-like putative cysteine protease